MQRRRLRAMAMGDRALIYHSGAQKAAVGIAEIMRAAQLDGAAPWVSVAVAARAPLDRPVTLAAMKATPALADLAMLRQSRLSVSPVRAAEWEVIVTLA